MSRPLSFDGAAHDSARPQEDWALVETLRDGLLLLAAIGASLLAVLLLSLALPGEPRPLRIGAPEPTAEPEQVIHLAPGQRVASAERRRPAWRVAAQE